MSKIGILTEETITEDEQYKNATGTDLPGNKRGLDIVVGSTVSSLTQMALLLIQGTMPEVNFNRIVETITSTTARDLFFIYDNSIQFSMSASTIFTGYDISVNNFNELGLESDTFDFFLLESGDQLTLEG